MMIFFSSCNSDSDDIGTDSLEEISSKENEEVTFSDPEKLISYVSTPENGYYKEKEIDEIKFSALLKPIDYIKAFEKIKTGAANIADDDDLQYFDLRIEVKDFSMEFLKYNLASTGDYAQRVAYCAYEMQNDIYLIDGNDTLPCVFYHFERTFNVVPFGHFILAFSPSKNKEFIRAKTLVYYDKLFNKGLIKMTFLPHDLIKVPKLINA